MDNTPQKNQEAINETLYSNGNDYFNDLIDDIENAKKNISIETYIFKNDSVGKEIVKKLKEKAKEGVTIKILVDGCGSPFFSTYNYKLKQLGIENKVYHPFPWQFWNWSRSVVKMPVLIKWIYLLLMIRKRNHRKVTIIDNKIAYLGSLNISNSHLKKTSGGEGWQDIGVRISNTDLSELVSAFDSCWHHRSIKEYIKKTFIKISKDPIFRLNNTRYRRRMLYKDLLKKIRSAKQRIFITNAYFMPENRLLKSLKDAAARACEVIILIPKKADTLIPIPWATALFYESLLKNNVKIFEYLPSMIHTKSIIIDNWVLVGSSNFDYISLKHNLEVDVRLTHQETKNEAACFFQDSLKKSRQLTLKNWKIHHPWHKRLIGRIILYFKYFI
jgi:cardiolipin synthase A/B